MSKQEIIKSANCIIDTIVNYFDYMKIENNKQLTRNDFLDLNDLFENGVFENAIGKEKMDLKDLENCDIILKELYFIAIDEVIFNKNKKFNKDISFNRDQALKDLIY